MIVVTLYLRLDLRLDHYIYWVGLTQVPAIGCVFSHCDSRDKQKADGVLGKVDETVRIGVVHGKGDEMVTLVAEATLDPIRKGHAAETGNGAAPGKAWRGRPGR